MRKLDRLLLAGCVALALVGITIPDPADAGFWNHRPQQCPYQKAHRKRGCQAPPVQAERPCGTTVRPCESSTTSRVHLLPGVARSNGDGVSCTMNDGRIGVIIAGGCMAAR